MKRSHEHCYRQLERRLKCRLRYRLPNVCHGRIASMMRFVRKHRTRNRKRKSLNVQRGNLDKHVNAGVRQNSIYPSCREIICFLDRQKQARYIYIACSNSDKKKSTATMRSMPIARNRRAARKAKTEGNLGVGGASTCVARNRAKERQSGDTRRGGGGGSGAGKEEGRCTHRGEGVGIAGIAWWQNARWSLEGPGGPRGRLKVAMGAARAHATHAYSAYAHGIHTALHKTGVCTDASEAHARAAA